MDRTSQGVLPRLERVTELIRDAKFELIPLKNALEQADFLPPGATVTVTASPTKGIEPTVALAEALANRGFRVVPHLSAHTIRDRAHLDAVLGRLRDARVSRAFVIGGDASTAGVYPDALSLLRAIADAGDPFDEIGVAGYPEGHPTIPPAVMRRALIEKATFASYVTTQLCFDAKAILRWVESVRDDGIDLPVHLGVAGAVDLPKLLSISTKIGVGSSLRYLKKHTGLLGLVFRRDAHGPERLLRDLGPALEDPAVGIERVHLFTFNQVEATERWRVGGGGVGQRLTTTGTVQVSPRRADNPLDPCPMEFDRPPMSIMYAHPYRADAGPIFRLTAFAIAATVAAGVALGALDSGFLFAMLLMLVVVQLLAGFGAWSSERDMEKLGLTTAEVAQVAPNVSPLVFAAMMGAPVVVMGCVSALVGGDPLTAKLLTLVGVANFGTGLIVRRFAVAPKEGAKKLDPATERRRKAVGVAIGVGLCALGVGLITLLES